VVRVVVVEAVVARPVAPAALLVGDAETSSVFGVLARVSCGADEVERLGVDTGAGGFVEEQAEVVGLADAELDVGVDQGVEVLDGGEVALGLPDAAWTGPEVGFVVDVVRAVAQAAVVVSAGLAASAGAVDAVPEVLEGEPASVRVEVAGRWLGHSSHPQAPEIEGTMKQRGHAERAGTSVKATHPSWMSSLSSYLTVSPGRIGLPQSAAQCPG
jgi:hypothetical protein